jgi:hypothetical protein
MIKKGSKSGRKTIRLSAGHPSTKKSRSETAGLPDLAPAELSATTRKTIEVPQAYFYLVKMAAVKRRIKEKQLWTEILTEYFKNHPVQ